MSDQAILVTGAAGFIGFHVARRLLAEGRNVVGLDNLNGYYDPALKQARLDILLREPGFRFRAGRSRRSCVNGGAVCETPVCRRWSISRRRPACAIQSTIRMPMPTPISRVSSMCWKDAGTMDAVICVYASSSSVYGANTKLPFSVDDRTDHPVSLYAATKKANELMALFL